MYQNVNNKTSKKNYDKSTSKLLPKLNINLIFLNSSRLLSNRFHYFINFLTIIMWFSHQQSLQFYNHFVSFSKQLLKYYILMLIANNVQQHTSFQFSIHVSFSKTFDLCHKNNIDDFTTRNTSVSIVISFFRLSFFKFLIFNRSFVIFTVSSNVKLFFFNNHNISLSSSKFFSNLIFEKVSNEFHETNFFSFNNSSIADILELNSNEKNFMLNDFDEQFAIDTFYDIDVARFSFIISSFTKHFENFVSANFFENSTFQSFFFQNSSFFSRFSLKRSRLMSIIFSMKSLSFFKRHNQSRQFSIHLSKSSVFSLEFKYRTFRKIIISTSSSNKFELQNSVINKFINNSNHISFSIVFSQSDHDFTRWSVNDANHSTEKNFSKLNNSVSTAQSRNRSNSTNLIKLKRLLFNATNLICSNDKLHDRSFFQFSVYQNHNSHLHSINRNRKQKKHETNDESLKQFAMFRFSRSLSLNRFSSSKSRVISQWTIRRLYQTFFEKVVMRTFNFLNFKFW